MQAFPVLGAQCQYITEWVAARMSIILIYLVVENKYDKNALLANWVTLITREFSYHGSWEQVRLSW